MVLFFLFFLELIIEILCKFKVFLLVNVQKCYPHSTNYIRRRGIVNHSECLNCRRMKESLTDSDGMEAVLKLGKLKQGH